MEGILRKTCDYFKQKYTATVGFYAKNISFGQSLTK
jgi:hypothetical protein